MALYEINFNAQTLNAYPTGFTRRWNTSQAAPQVKASAQWGNIRAHRRVNSTASRALDAIDAIDADGDRANLKFRALVYSGTNSSNAQTPIWGCVARASGASGDETGYAFALTRTASSEFRLNFVRYYNSVNTNLQSSATSVWSLDTWYWMDGEISGTNPVVLTMRLFSLADIETPIATWTYEDSSASRIESAGWVGIGGFVSSTDIEISEVTIATGATALPAFVPRGKAVIGTITPGSTTASVPYTTANVFGADSYEGRVDGGTPFAVGASPASFTGLTASALYNTPGAEIRPINFAGAGEWSDAASFTTEAAGAIRLRVDQLLYQDVAETTLYSGSGLTYRVITQGATASLVYQTTVGAVSSGVLEITDAAFETLTDTFDVVVKAGSNVQGVFPATVVDS